MAKLGRYSSDRKKVQSLTAAYTVTQADCGTIFMLNLAAGFTVTLPSVADAGKGWWCKFIVGTNCTSNDYIITEVAASDTNVLVSQVNELETDTNTDGPSDTGHTTITLPNAADTVGDIVEVICDGSNFYCQGQTKLDGGMVLA